ncbi:MAG: carbohydrate-binding family 9-like protein [Fimbriimonadales bacterium]|nr:carbohydrate-binding family 9-like protein [Fimbriimonadales bacterium]
MSVLNPRRYLCHRATTPIRLDGRLDDPAWRDAPWTEDFVDIEGDAKPLPRHRTRAKMLWDDDFFYIGAELEEPNVWATLTEHDSIIFLDNDFEVFLDPDSDNHLYYELEVNALNTTWDLLLNRPYKDGGTPISHWEMKGVRTAVFVDGTLNNPLDTDRGWSVEIAIPWSAIMESKERPDALGRPPTPWKPDEGTTWRVNFSRVEWDVEVEGVRIRKVPNRPEHNWVWSPQEVIDMHRPEHWGYVQFTHAEPGQGAFVDDPSRPARAALHEAYYALHEHRRIHGAWPDSLREVLPNPGLPMRLHTTPSLFEVHCDCEYEDGSVHRWAIRQDALVWEVPL